MELKLDFNSEDVAKKLTEVLITTTFKKALDDAVSRAVADLTARNGYNGASTIENAVKEHLRWTIHDMLKTEYKEAIESAIRNAIKEEKIKDWAEALANKIDVKGY